MIKVVLDNSVVMRWLMKTEHEEDQAYANAVLQQLQTSNSLVPDLWLVEVTNILLFNVKKSLIQKSDANLFMSRLADLEIETVAVSTIDNARNVSKLANEHNLTSYDAAYLSLALESDSHIASLDKQMIKAAQKLEVKLFFAEKLRHRLN